MLFYFICHILSFNETLIIGLSIIPVFIVEREIIKYNNKWLNVLWKKQMFFMKNNKIYLIYYYV